MHADGNNPPVVAGMEMLGRSLDRAVSAFIEDIHQRGLADHVSNPAYATSVGLVLYAARHRGPSAAAVGGGALTRVMGRLRTVFKEFF